MKKGKVYLVGAGPGDPALLTVKALKLIQEAEVVIYDKLVGVQILEMIRWDAEKIDVGKLPDYHKVPQGEINQRILEEALKGQVVVRLKGGDPFLFGRGGEELELLVQLLAQMCKLKYYQYLLLIIEEKKSLPTCCTLQKSSLL